MLAEHQVQELFPVVTALAVLTHYAVQNIELFSIKPRGGSTSLGRHFGHCVINSRFNLVLGNVAMIQVILLLQVRAHFNLQFICSEEGGEVVYEVLLVLVQCNLIIVESAGL